MSTSVNLRLLHLKYPNIGDKVFVSPGASFCASEDLSNYTTTLQFVSSPEEADCIPLLATFTDGISDNAEAMDLYKRFPAKCCSSRNLLGVVNWELPRFENDKAQSVRDYLKAKDPEAVWLGLCLLKQFNLSTIPPDIKNQVRTTLSTLRKDPKEGFVIKVNDCNFKIPNLDIINYYNIIFYNSNVI